MDFLRTKVEDHIYHILLDRGKSNAIDLIAVDELIEAIDTFYRAKKAFSLLA
jgi:enoyl-CoA hydratase/carnithine racemase